MQGTTRPRRGAHIVFLHGWGGDSSAFSLSADMFARAGYGVITPDFSGFGDNPEPTEPRGVPEYAADILSLMDREGVAKAVFVGHSFGGRVALEIAAKHRERVVGLALVDAAGLKPRRKPSYYFRVALHKLSVKLGGKGLAGSSDYRVLSPVMKECFKRIVGYDQTPLLPLVGCPTAIFWGRGDRDTPFYMAKKFRKGIKDSHIFTLDGGHFAYLEDSAHFLPVLRAFVEEITK